MPHSKHYLLVLCTIAGKFDMLATILSSIAFEHHQLSVIIYQHTGKFYSKRFKNLLNSSSEIKLQEIKENQTVEPGVIYYLNASSNFSIENFNFKNNSQIKSVSELANLCKSASNTFKNRLIAVTLSELENECYESLKYIITQQGHTILCLENTLEKVQETTLKEYINEVVAPENIGVHIMHYLQNGKPKKIKEIHDELKDFKKEILGLVQSSYATDFSQYKTSTIERRIERRMSINQIAEENKYLRFLKDSPTELNYLFNDLLINVTSFFRDPAVFEFLQHQLLQLVASKKDGEQLRMWVPACSTGEEAYTLGILITSILEQQNKKLNVQIFASDIDDDAIAKARKGRYTAMEVKNIPQELLRKYFIKNLDYFEISKPVRALMLFSKHDITTNPPFVKLDLISCRNLLIYFKQSLQATIFQLFHYALVPNGLLLLGKSETTRSFGHMFSVVNSNFKLYSKIPALFNRRPMTKKLPLSLEPILKPEKLSDISIEDILKENLFTQLDLPYVVINEQNDIIRISGEVAPMMSFGQGQISNNLIKNLHPNLQSSVRILLTESKKTKQKQRGTFKRIDIYSETFFVCAQIVPLHTETINQELILILFEKLSINDFGSSLALNELPKDNENLRIKELERELEQLKTHLQTIVEELENSNEELQSMNEEMQSANEEMQVTNEELETSNEELQNANSEMAMAYTEMRELNSQLAEKEAELGLSLDRFNLLLQNSLQGYILCKSNYLISVYNEEANRIVKQLTGKNIGVDHNILTLIGNDTLEEFTEIFTKTLAGNLQSIERILSNNHNTYYYKIQFIPVRGITNETDHVLLSYTDITVEHKQHRKIVENEANLNSILENTDGAMWSIDANGKLIVFNTVFKSLQNQISHLKIEKGLDFFELLNGIHREEYISVFKKTLEGQRQEFESFREFTKGKISYFKTSLYPIFENGKVVGASCISIDITKIKESEIIVKESEARLQAILENTDASIYSLDTSFCYINFNAAIKKRLKATYGFDIAVGQNTYEFLQEFDPNEAEYWAEIYNQALRGKSLRFIKQFNQNGEHSFFDFSINPIFEKDIVTGLSCIAYDITQNILNEKKVAESEVRFRSLIEQGNDMASMIDTNLRLIYESPNRSKLLGYTNEEWSKLKPIELLHPDDVAKSSEVISKCLKRPQHPYQAKLRFKKRDGSYMTAIGSISNLLDVDGVNAIVTNFRDVTGEELAKEHLLASEIRFKNIIEQLPFAVVSFNSSGFVNATNHTWNNLFPETIYSLTDYNILNDQNFSNIGLSYALKKAFFGEIVTLNPIDFVPAIQLRKSCKHWLTLTFYPLLSDTKEVLEVILIINDITDAQEAQRALESSQANLKTLFDNTTVGYLLISLEKKIVSYNQAASEIVGKISGKDLQKGSSASTFIHPAREKALSRMFKDVIKGKALAYDIETPLNAGGTMWVSVQFAPIYSGMKDIEGMIMSITDITAKKESNIREQKITNELVQRNKDLEQFAYIISHNLRSPVANIMGFAEILRDGNFDTMQQQYFIQELTNSVFSLDSVIKDLNQILTVKRQITERFEIINFNKITQEVIRSISDVIQREKATISFDFEIENYNCIKSYIHSIFYNLISNAIKYKAPNIPPHISISSQIVDDYIVLKFKDNGMGIDLTKKGNQVFGLYKKFNKDIEGKGMGLFMVKTQVESIGGQIAIESIPNKGTLFTITLPYEKSE